MLIFRVNPRKAQVEVKATHEPPCLLNEIYMIVVQVVNKEDEEIRDVR